MLGVIDDPQDNEDTPTTGFPSLGIWTEASGVQRSLSCSLSTVAYAARIEFKP